MLNLIVFGGATTLLGLAAGFVLSKCFFLAPVRAGWAMLLANVVYETLEIKLRLRRAWLDSGLLAFVPVGAGFLWGWPVAAGVALTMGGAWVAALAVDLRWRSDGPARQFAASTGRVPLPIPRLDCDPARAGAGANERRL
jgi:hypothetical protein